MYLFSLTEQGQVYNIDITHKKVTCSACRLDSTVDHNYIQTMPCIHCQPEGKRQNYWAVKNSNILNQLSFSTTLLQVKPIFI